MLQAPSLAGAVALAPPAGPTGTTVAPRARDSVLEIRFQIHDQHAPAFRSAVEELVNELGGRLEGMYSFAQEQALTDATCAIGNLKSATFAAIPAGDPAYKTRRR